MTLIIRAHFYIHTTVIERATVIAVVEKANPEERIWRQRQIYIERYIVHTSLQ